MPKKEQKEDIVCPKCGEASPPDAQVCSNCSEPLGPGAAPSESEGVEALMSVPGIGDAKAHELYKAGYRSVDDLQKATPEDLANVKGIGDKLAAKIIESAHAVAAPKDEGLASWLSGEDEGLSSWLSGREGEEPKPAVADEPELPHDETLAKWLSGDEEGLDSWLTESPIKKTGEGALEHPEEILEQQAEIVELRESLKALLGKFQVEGFDPSAVVDELAKARAEVEAGKAQRRQLEEELENVKRGSIAVIKFIKKQQASGADAVNLADQLATEMSIRENLELKVMELETLVAGLRDKTEKSIAASPPDVQELRRQEIELTERKAKVDALEHQLRAKEEALKEGLFSYTPVPRDSGASLEQVEATAAKEKEMMDEIHSLQAKLSQSELDIKHVEERLAMAESGKAGMDPELIKKLEQAQGLESSVSIRDREIERLKEELRIREDEMTKLKEPLAYKEQEMNRREDDLMYRERLLQEELKRVAHQKMEVGSSDEITLKKRLEELKAEVTQKEEEIRNKEKYLAMKEEELRAREQGVIGEEIEKREQERLMELKVEKVKTGTARLDDLLLGGIPFGSNVLIYGPPFTGKEVLVNSFIADGLKKGIPAIWVITEKSPKEMREEMMFVLSGYEEYEKRGLVRYIDTYSRSMGDESQDPYTDYVEAPTDYESIQKAIENAAKEFKSKHEYYRLGFRSISTLIAYLDPNTAFRFLSPVVGRRKRDRAVSMFTIEKGVHGEQEIQMLGSLMDGMIDLKVENLNTFLAVKGICEVQSRAFIRYSATKSGLNIGSFSLDHIR
ncbi:MAG: ATPase domain-containing protein [Candidatus Thermoplasmatota archaeon]